MEQEVCGPKALRLHTPKLIVHPVSEIDERPVITSMFFPLILFLNDAIFLIEIGSQRMGFFDIFIIFDQRIIIQNKPPCKGGNIG